MTTTQIKVLQRITNQQAQDLSTERPTFELRTVGRKVALFTWISYFAGRKPCEEIIVVGPRGGVTVRK